VGEWLADSLGRIPMRFHLTTEPLTSSNLREALPLWPDRCAFTEAEFRRAYESARRLLRENRAQGSLLRANGRACGVGMTVFVTESFALRYGQRPFPHLGRHLLIGTQGREAAILTEKAIGVANAGEGLHMAVVITHIDPGVADRVSTLGTLIQAFVTTHAGFRIRAIINEVFGDANIADVRAGDAFAIRAEFDPRTSTACIPSIVSTLDRAYVIARRSPFLPMFVYNEPQIVFSDEQRTLLKAALDGDPDEVLAKRLGVSVHAIKARWTRIQQRAVRRQPLLLEHIRAAAHNRRGPQIRHIILRYVRTNPSELRPYAQ
jgi:hypothetical protein